ncbi:MAG: hypothetical protein OES69_15340 [Myxococcales bacterium]|nr:hypothetical protein [Myxococcales bacterium]MDH3845317.1 hypothetical protein [Myxococcales bacterium]
MAKRSDAGSRAIGPSYNNIITYVPFSTCQIATSDPNVCGIAIPLNGGEYPFDKTATDTAEDNPFYDEAMMNWTYEEEDEYDMEVSQPGGAN